MVDDNGIEIKKLIKITWQKERLNLDRLYQLIFKTHASEWMSERRQSKETKLILF